MAKETTRASKRLLPIAASEAPAGALHARRLVLLGCFICYIDRVSIAVVVVLMQDEFGWSETIKGLVLSAAFIGYLLVQIPSGVLGAAVVWWSLATILNPPAAMASLVALITARAAMGLDEATPASPGLSCRWARVGERARGVSFLLSGAAIGTLCALSIIGWTVVRYGWLDVVCVLSTLGLLWVIIWNAAVAGGSAPAAPDVARSTSPTCVPRLQLFSRSAVWTLIIKHLCSNWTLCMLLAWLPSYFTRQGLSVAPASRFSAAAWLTMFVMVNVVAWGAELMIRRGRSLMLVRNAMQTIGLLGSAGFLLLASDAQSPTTALLIMCGALGTLAFTWSGFAPNHLDIAPRHADVLMSLANTAGVVSGISGVLITGWLVDTTGTYASAFALAAAINACGALVWLGFSTSGPVVESND